MNDYSKQSKLKVLWANDTENVQISKAKLQGNRDGDRCHLDF